MQTQRTFTQQTSEGTVFPDYLEVATAVVVSAVELVKLLSVYRYIVLTYFSYSGPSGILRSDGKQNAA